MAARLGRPLAGLTVFLSLALLAAFVSGAPAAARPLSGAAGLQTPTPTPNPAYDVFVPAFFYNAGAPLRAGQLPDTLPGPGWWTELLICNFGPQAANVVVTAQDASGPNSYATFIGALLACQTLLPEDIPVPQGFTGSLVVRSDQPIAVRATLTNRQSGPYGTLGGVAQGSFQGLPRPLVATTVVFPVVKQAAGPVPDIKTSTFFVQNAGAVAADITISYLCPALYSQTVLGVDPGDMVELNPSAAGVPAGSLCAGAATSTEPLAALAAEHFNAEPVGMLLETTRGLVAAEAATTLYAPGFRNRVWTEPPNATRSTAVTLLNASASSITISAIYKDVEGCAGTWFELSPPVAPGATHTFAAPAGMPTDCLAAATFIAGGNMLGVAQESYRNPLVPPGTQSTTRLRVRPAAEGSTGVLEPQFPEKYNGKTAALQIQNVSALTATLHVVFRAGATSWTTVNEIVAPGGGVNYYLVSDCTGCWVGAPMPAGTNATALIISDQPVIADVVELPYPDCLGQAGGPCLDRRSAESFVVLDAGPSTPTPTPPPGSTATPTATPWAPASRWLLPVMLYSAESP
jgi:hypothetical protein